MQTPGTSTSNLMLSDGQRKKLLVLLQEAEVGIAAMVTQGEVTRMRRALQVRDILTITEMSLRVNPLVDRVLSLQQQLQEAQTVLSSALEAGTVAETQDQQLEVESPPVEKCQQPVADS